MASKLTVRTPHYAEGSRRKRPRLLSRSPKRLLGRRRESGPRSIAIPRDPALAAAEAEAEG
jgi:hypothetical protein